MSEPFPFIYVRSDALYDEELLKSPATFQTLCVISIFAKRKKDGSCYFKQNTVAKHLGKSRQAISQHLQTLSNLGYIKIITQTYNGARTNNAYRILYDTPLVSVPQGELAPPQGELAPPRKVSLRPPQGELAAKPVVIKPEKKEKALTRDEFLRAVDQGLKDGAFKNWEYLTETEIFAAADECLDFYGAKGEWPAGEPAIVLRHWIRGGVKNKSIRKKPSVAVVRCEHLQKWQSEAIEKGIFKLSEFKSWIEPLEWNGNETVYAPTRFSKAYLEKNFMQKLQAALHPQIKIEVKEQSQ